MNPNELFKSIKAAADYKGNSNGRLSLWDIQQLHTRSENCLRYEAFNNGDTAEVLITIRDLDILLANYVESNKMNPLCIKLATNVALDSIPELTMAVKGDHHHDYAFDPSDEQIDAFIIAANKSRLFPELYHGRMHCVPHSPALFRFNHSLGFHTDGGGLFLLYLHEGRGVYKVKSEDGKVTKQVTLNKGDVLLSNDFLLHSYKPSIASTCLVFNVETKSQ